MSEEVQFQEDAVCGECGRAGAFEFSEGPLCLDCYAARGSCCSAEFPESGAAD